MKQVRPVQLAGRMRQSAGQIAVADDVHTADVCVTSLGTVTSQLPPCSAARSTITLPGRIDSTISRVINFGAGFPGINAVVMMMSTSLAWAANNAISASMNSLLIVLA